MRTLRELAGWTLLLAVVLTPFAGLGLLLLAVEEGWGVAVLGLLALLAWPRVWLSARRLREPPAEEIAEADGRAPVALLHRFARAGEPLIARSLLVLPGLWRELRDAALERSITKAASHVGPVLSLTRRAPPPTHGPMSLADDPEWERALDRALRPASLAVIVLDGSVANGLEIERARALLGLARTALVVPAHLASERYEALRARLPLLPPYDPRIRVIRFDHEERAYFMRELLLRDEERAPAPRAPASTLFLSGIPLAAGLLAAITLPFLLDAFSFRVDDEEWAAWGVATFLLGVVLAVLSRRAFRLVPSSEAIMVTVAASPWLVTEVLLWIARPDGAGSHWITNRLTAGAVGAAYSAPLLAASAIVLASGSLVRASSDRTAAFAILGAASLLPFAPLLSSLEEFHTPSALVMLTVSAAAVGLGMAAWAASGEPSRANAPLPIGAAVAAALTVGALCTVVGHAAWRDLLGAFDGYGVASARGEDAIGALSRFGAAWPYFVWAGPMMVVLIASQFARRATRPAIASMVVLVPLVLLTGMAAGAEAAARAHIERWIAP